MRPPWASPARPGHWGGTGNVPAAPGWDAGILAAGEHPRVRAQMEMGFPAVASLKTFVEGVYNQEQTPECSSHSAAAGLSLLTRKLLGPGNWFPMDAHELFRAGHGTSAGGFMQDMDTVIDTRGAYRLSTQTLYQDAAWAVIPSTSAASWADLVCAAIAAGMPIHLAILLWPEFGSAPSGVVMPNEYHAVLLTGYDRTGPEVLFEGLNSWGPGFGQGGFFKVSASYVTQQNFMNGWHYGLALTGSGGSVNPPPPAPLAITSLSPTTLGIGDVLTINGTGFGAQTGLAGVGFTLEKGAQVVTWSETQITCRVPAGAVSGRIAVVTADGRLVFSNTPVMISGGSNRLPIDGKLTGQVGNYAINGTVHLGPRTDGAYDLSGIVRTN